MGNANTNLSQERATTMGTMTVKELKEELTARDIQFDPKAKKAELEAMLRHADERDERATTIQGNDDGEVKLLELPEERVTSRYEDEQELIDQGYKLVEDNLDKSKTWLIQELQKLKIPTSYISKMIGAHYSFVHTVVSSAGLEVVEKRTKSDEMREMFRAGLKVSEVSKIMGAHYSYVHGVYKRWMDSEGKKQ